MLTCALGPVHCSRSFRSFRRYVLLSLTLISQIVKRVANKIHAHSFVLVCLRAASEWAVYCPTELHIKYRVLLPFGPGMPGRKTPLQHPLSSGCAHASVLLAQ